METENEIDLVLSISMYPLDCVGFGRGGGGHKWNYSIVTVPFIFKVGQDGQQNAIAVELPIFFSIDTKMINGEERYQIKNF